MIFKIPQLINYVSSITTLEKGDLILTGTPAGVGPMMAGSTITVGLRLPGKEKDITTAQFPVVARPGIGLFGTGKV
jgi:acylpyruvate hydrolase